MATKKEKHEPTKSFDWQLYAEELEKECERLKHQIAQTQDEANWSEFQINCLKKTVAALTTALYYINNGGDNE